MTRTPPTSHDAYEEIIESGEDVSLRRRVAAALADSPKTTKEVARTIPDASENSIRPRLNELLRMDCVERDGTRTNPSGHDAYIHHLTDRGHAYAAGDIPDEEIEPEPPLAEHKGNVVAIAREVVRGNATTDILHLAVERHDRAKQRRDPEWDGGLTSENGGDSA